MYTSVYKTQQGYPDETYRAYVTLLVFNHLFGSYFVHTSLISGNETIALISLLADTWQINEPTR